MSGEIDYRRYAGRPVDRPKYLSDRLTPLQGNWTSGPTIDYTGLPSGDIQAKLIMSRADAGALNLTFIFNEKQYLVDYNMEFWIRATVAAGTGVTVWLVGPNYNYQLRYLGIGVLPANWTRYSFQIPSQTIVYGPRGKYYVAGNMTAFYIEVTAPVGGCTYEVAGLNFRRLP